MKFETFIKEEYREPDNKTKTFFKRYGFGEPSPVTKSYYDRVYDKGYLIEFMVYGIVKKFMNYDFMGDMPSEK